MISSTLMANGAKVYIVGLQQAQLDRYCDIYSLIPRVVQD
jgi:hypothetical protein